MLSPQQMPGKTHAGEVDCSAQLQATVSNVEQIQALHSMMLATLPRNYNPRQRDKEIAALAKANAAAKRLMTVRTSVP